MVMETEILIFCRLHPKLRSILMADCDIAFMQKSENHLPTSEDKILSFQKTSEDFLVVESPQKSEFNKQATSMLPN